MKVKGSKSKKKSSAEVDEMELEGDYILKPQKTAPATDTSEWPLLLKVFPFLSRTSTN